MPAIPGSVKLYSTPIFVLIHEKKKKRHEDQIYMCNTHLNKKQNSIDIQKSQREKIKGNSAMNTKDLPLFLDF